MHRVKARLLVASCIIATSALMTPSKAVDLAVVRSDGGLVASGSFGPAPGDAPDRTISVLFVVPSGQVVASDGASTFSRPWAAVRVVDRTGGPTCESVGNPTEFSAGSRRGNPARLVGVSVTVDCGGRAYAVQWDQSHTWLASNTIGRTHGEKVLAWAGDQQRGTVAVWPDEQQSSPLTLCEGPIGAPRHCTGRRGFGAAVLSSTGVVTTAIRQ